jgi:hypothetical protein
MNKLFLRLVMLPSGLWQGMGADIEQLKAVLTVKLKMDDRKPLGFGKQRAQKKERKAGSFFSVFISFVMGCLYIMPLALFQDNVFALWAYYTTFVFILSFMLITDFSNVLFDPKDKFTLLHRPVNDSTLLLSRILHVFIYLLRIVLPMCLPGWIFVGFSMGWQYALLFPIPLLLMVFMVLFIVNGFYLLLLKFASPGRFKEIINAFQIVFSIIIFAMSYLMPRVLNHTMIDHLDLHSFGWVRYMPSYWLAACYSWFGATTVLAGTKMIGLLAIVVPLVCLWITVKYLSPQFAVRIGAVDAFESGEGTAKAKSGSSSRLYLKLAKLFNRTSAGQAGFVLTWLQTSRSRTFKMRVYPTFAYVPIYFVYLMTLSKQPLKEVWATIATGNKFLVLLYMSAFVMAQAINYVTSSDQYKAAWIYYASPVEKPGKVMDGAFKAVWVKYFLPYFFIISIFILSVWGPGKILDIILAMVNVTLFIATIIRFSFRAFPFSLMEQISNSGTKILKTFITLIIPTGLGFGHYMAIVFHLGWLKILFFILSSILLWLIWDSYSNTSWEDLKREEI